MSQSSENGGLPDWYKEKYPNWANGVWVLKNPENDKEFITVSHTDYVQGFTYLDYVRIRETAGQVLD